MKDTVKSSLSVLDRSNVATGPVVRVAPHRLSYNSTEALQDIYGNRKANVRKAGFTECLALLHGGARNVQTINELSIYGPRRRLISQAFSEEALRSGEDYILDNIRFWCKALGSESQTTGSWTNDIDMEMWATNLTVDILGALCFGTGLGAIKQRSSPAAQAMTESARQAQIVSH